MLVWLAIKSSRNLYRCAMRLCSARPEDQLIRQESLEIGDRASDVIADERTGQQQCTTIIPIWMLACVEQLRRLGDKQGSLPHQLVVGLSQSHVHDDDYR
ncbi:hypothetical protein AB0L63_29145 [Nocardia sp. NPDC051990]|uniref:hypothetical protein n=1 Tax=Nocardia sp. NPDC051990 TaxID=3155285 RepID=UPI003422FEA2